MLIIDDIKSTYFDFEFHPIKIYIYFGLFFSKRSKSAGNLLLVPVTKERLNLQNIVRNGFSKGHF